MEKFITFRYNGYSYEGFIEGVNPGYTDIFLNSNSLVRRFDNSGMSDIEEIDLSRLKYLCIDNGNRERYEKIQKYFPDNRSFATDNLGVSYLLMTNKSLNIRKSYEWSITIESESDHFFGSDIISDDNVMGNFIEDFII